MVLFLVFSAAIVLIVPVFIFRWVNLPLKSITAALENEDPACLQRISKQTTEFGQVVRMIESFFSQKQIILKEVAQRKQTQDALNKVNNCFDCVCFSY